MQGGKDSEASGLKGTEYLSQSVKNALDSEETEIPKAKGIDAVSVLWTFGKCLGALLPVYLAGYYRVSTSLLVFGLMVYTGWKHSREAKESRLRSAIQSLHDEQEYTSMKVFKNKRDLPAWVNFPDVEKVEWLNKVLQQVWPFVGQYLEKLLVETIAPSIRNSSSHLQTLSFTKVDFGDKAMKVVGVKAHTENERGQVLLDLYISYVGDVEIDVEVKRYFCKAGVKGIQLHGMMRVILEPLIGDVPIVGAVTMFFIRRPKLDINWTGLTNLLDIPGLNVMSDSMIMDAIASFLVLPNRLTVPLVADLHVAQLRSPLPRGVVRIHLVEAEDLAAKDNYMKGVIAGMSDPYALLRVGPQTFTSHHIDNTLCPKWGEMYEVIVHEVPGQELEVEVYDKDTDQDDFLGRTKVDLGIVKKSTAVDEWFPLKDTRSGRIHLKMEWLTLLPNTDQLDQVLQRNESVIVSSKTADPPSAAILAVYLDKAEALPMKKGSKEPSPMVQLSVQDITRESRTCYTTINPEWEDAFTFFIQDPRQQDIDIQVKDNDRVQTLGSLTIPLSRLLSSPNLSLDQWFQLNNSGPASRIYINIVLRVLWLDELKVSTSLLSTEAALLAAGRSKPRPQHTTPDPSFATEGVLRIHLLEGQHLVPKDNLMGGMVKGKSDPYVVINIGGETFRSQVIKGNLNPTWNEMYEVVLTQLPGQELQLELFDKDMDMKDDFMGRLKVSLKDIISSQYTDQWYTLNDVKSGRVHLVLEWVPTVSEPSRLDQVMQFHSKQSFQNKAVPSVALLFVYVDSANGLPLKKSGKEPKVGAELILGHTSHKTTVCDRSTSPQWDEAFYFLVRDPREQVLIVKLSHSWSLPIGSLVVPVRELLSEPQLVLDQWLSLDGASPDSQILLRAQLKVLSPKMCQRGADQTEPSMAPSNMATKQSLDRDMAQKSSARETPAAPVSSSLPVSEGAERKAADKVVPKPVTEDKVVPKPVTEDKVVPKPVTEDKVVPKAVTPDIHPPATPLPPHTTPGPRFGAEGVLRIHLLEAQNLVAKDNLMGGMVKGKSDPYVEIHIGDANFKSHVIKENLNPTWNEMYEAILVPTAGLEVQIELYDKDMDKDDFLGRFKVSISDIIQSQYTDQWYTLNDTKSGRVHLVLEWVPTVSEPSRLDKVLQLQSLQSFHNKAVPSAALLFVYMDRAHSLPLKKSGKEPKAAAELVVGKSTHRTKVCDRSTSPQWDEYFYFQVYDPREDMLIVKLSSDWEQALGSLVVPVRELLSQPQLLLDQWLSLDGASADSQILLRAQLKILNSKMTDEVAKPQVSVIGPDTFAEAEEEEPVTAIEQSVTAANEEEPHCQVQSEKPVALFSHPSVPQPETREAEPDVTKRDPSPADMAVHRHAHPDPSASVQVEEPGCTEVEKPEATAPESLPTAKPKESGIGGLIQATVTTLPSITVPVVVKSGPHPAVTRPSHTTPDPGFGREGVLRIHLLEAQNLVAKDNLMGGMVKGKSDPYVKIHIGDTKFKSHVIKENLNPIWNEMYEVVLSVQAGQQIQFELYDKDLDSDDFLGRFTIRLSDVISSHYIDQWYTLNDVKSGRVHLVLEWVPTVSEPSRLDQVLQLQSLQYFHNKAVPSAALLFVYMDRAHSLPLKKSGKEPKAGAELVVGDTTYRTKVCDRSTSPHWKESVHFVVHDPKHEMLIVKLSSGWEQALGSLVVPVRVLLSEPQLVLDQWLSLDGASPDSQILLRAQLKILESKMVEMISQGTVPCSAYGGGSGQVKLSLSYASKERKLVVVVHACRGLVSSSPPDTYISLMLLPDKSKATKKKTATKKKDLNPEYNERFEFDVSVEEARFRHLSVSVKNSSTTFRSREKDVLGQVQIELAQIDLVSGITKWLNLEEAE
ncbi:extended synaptotagmin-1 isoform X1 [Osmerus eperlanus]|uniref:extended synaptotagmin-1 isoform X1 n=1 Tax=Osmerus eperlanus TaxID=29151 RepID=UPI002E140C29